VRTKRIDSSIRSGRNVNLRDRPIEVQKMRIKLLYSILYSILVSVRHPFPLIRENQFSMRIKKIQTLGNH